MKSEEIRKKFLEFFKNRRHKIVPSSSLVPEGDPSVLFTTAGMQQFKPYYIGEKNAEDDFGLKNTTSVQKCVRTSDIDEVGDNTHLTFFEMLGNFSFGEYFKREAIEYAYLFITKELKLDISYVTIFQGFEGVPRDEESKEIWASLGVKEIREQGMEDVFWGPTGNEGPCGPTTEIYCKNAAGEDVEIWNIVFNEYFCHGTKEALMAGSAKLVPLPVKGIDTGMGLERLLTIIQKKESVFDTDLFEEINSKIEILNKDLSIHSREARIVADHMRTAVFMINDGIRPANPEGGFILRRILRRAVRYADILELPESTLLKIARTVSEKYQSTYPSLKENILTICEEIEKEEIKFRETLENGMKEFEKGRDAFTLFTTYGFPLELTQELAKEKEKGKDIDIDDFYKKMEVHQNLSRTSSAGVFKGGLANHEPKTIKLHTAHHLLLAALQIVLGKNVKQRGSNITEERLRLDFSFDRKMTDEEKKKVEDMVNEKIKEGLKVEKREMNKTDAEKLGAEMEFGAKYGNIVSVYFIEDGTTPFSVEFCGGPHVSNTSELGTFKILKEEASSQGVRRIKAILI